MWIIYSFLSAFFAGITSILAKCGIKNTSSSLATAIRTIIVLLFSWIMVFITGSQDDIYNIDSQSLILLILSGIATGVSWLCYFKALQTGDINKVIPIDKSSTVLTILLSFTLFQESLSYKKVIGVILIGLGTYMMIQKKANSYSSKNKNDSWFIYAVLSAVFASLTAILGKMGISGVNANLGTALRTFVILIISWLVVFLTGKQHEIKDISKCEIGFICLSGIATGASWLCYYKALKDGIMSAVVAIDKLSILVTVAFSYIVFHEKLTKKSALGLAAIVLGTFLILFQQL